MGFDIHGMNPVEREGTPIPDFNGDYDSDEFKEWCDAKNKHEELNPGTYFRNNVWWWRPLWAYVCEECHDVINDDDADGGGSNEGHAISEQKAVAIAKRLFELIEEGETGRFEDFHKKKAEEADADNERLIADGGKKYDAGWNWADSYPFAVDNVRAFATFCSESGGFEIC